MKSAIEQLLLAYVRCVPMRRGKYRLVELYGRWNSGKDDFIRRAWLKYGGYQMDCDIRKLLQRQFYFFGTYFLEERILARWSELAKIAPVVLDIGANAGIYSLAAAANNPTVVIHAFEPTPEISAHFRKTINQNGLSHRVFLHQSAVARESGIAYLNYFAGEHNDNEAMNYITAKGKSATSIAVTTISIDDFCEQHGISFVELVKIDVQGNEPEVLAGAEKLLLRKGIKTIFLELNWDHKNQAACPASKVVHILENSGFLFADPNVSGRMKFRKAGPWLNALSDVVATTQRSN
jgi:FkbM family methyltransferase